LPRLLIRKFSFNSFNLAILIGFMFFGASCASTDIFENESQFDSTSITQMALYRLTFDRSTSSLVDMNAGVMVVFSPSAPKRSLHVKYVARSQADILSQYSAKVGVLPYPVDLNAAFDKARDHQKEVLFFLRLDEGLDAQETLKCDTAPGNPQFCQHQEDQWLAESFNYNFWVYTTEDKQLLHSGKVILRLPLPRVIDHTSTLYDQPMHLIAKKIFGLPYE